MSSFTSRNSLTFHFDKAVTSECDGSGVELTAVM